MTASLALITFLQIIPGIVTLRLTGFILHPVTILGFTFFTLHIGFFLFELNQQAIFAAFFLLILSYIFTLGYVFGYNLVVSYRSLSKHGKTLIRKNISAFFCISIFLLAFLRLVDALVRADFSSPAELITGFTSSRYTTGDEGTLNVISSFTLSLSCLLTGIYLFGSNKSRFIRLNSLYILVSQLFLSLIKSSRSELYLFLPLLLVPAFYSAYFQLPSNRFQNLQLRTIMILFALFLPIIIFVYAFRTISNYTEPFSFSSYTDSIISSFIDLLSGVHNLPIIIDSSSYPFNQSGFISLPNIGLSAETSLHNLPDLILPNGSYSNVYTGVGDLIYDWGLTGVQVIFLLLGILSGCLWQLSFSGNLLIILNISMINLLTIRLLTGSLFRYTTTAAAFLSALFIVAIIDYLPYRRTKE